MPTPLARTPTRRALPALLLLTSLLALVAACGSSGSGGASPTPPAPLPGDPAFGAAGQALVSNLGRTMWIGYDDPEVATLVEQNLAEGNIWWLGGEVVPDATRATGFYFRPATVFTGEISAEAFQTTIDQISADPPFFAPGGAGNLDTWLILATLLATE